MTAGLQKLEELNPNQVIHLSGIGGSAMNGLAVLLTQKGYRVRGTDPNIDTATNDRLAQFGIETFARQDGSAIAADTQLVITTAALPPEHPELQAAIQRRIPIVKYAAMLGVVMNSHKGIAIAGTHGKTTTTALTVSALRGAGLDPGFVIGGYVNQFGAGAHGGKEYFVAEACEYDRSFLNLRPSIAVITNIEADHLDIYSGLDDIIDSFTDFARNITPGGTLIFCSDSDAATALAQRFTGNRISYGMSHADFTATNICNQSSGVTFTAEHNGHPIATVALKLSGQHNVLNALAALCAGLQLGAEPARMADGLAEFCGVQRRFDTIGSANSIQVIDDYAHHPTEIQALLQATKDRFPDARIVVAFQPHQISRTRFFFDDFAKAFTLADAVFLPDIYVARDKEAPPEITSENLAKRICENRTWATYTGDFDTTATKAAAHLQPGDIFLTVGAGDIYEVAHKVLRLLKSA